MDRVSTQTGLFRHSLNHGSALRSGAAQMYRPEGSLPLIEMDTFTSTRDQPSAEQPSTWIERDSSKRGCGEPSVHEGDGISVGAGRRPLHWDNGKGPVKLSADYQTTMTVRGECQTANSNDGHGGGKREFAVGVGGEVRHDVQVGGSVEGEAGSAGITVRGTHQSSAGVSAAGSVECTEQDQGFSVGGRAEAGTGVAGSVSAGAESKEGSSIRAAGEVSGGPSAGAGFGVGAKRHNGPDGYTEVHLNLGVKVLFGADVSLDIKVADRDLTSWITGLGDWATDPNRPRIGMNPVGTSLLHGDSFQTGGSGETWASTRLRQSLNIQQSSRSEYAVLA